MMMRSGEMVSRSSKSAEESCPTRLQQMQPLRSSRTPEMDCEDASAESMARSPSSFLRRASCEGDKVWLC